MKNKILYIKGLSPSILTTEQTALNVLHDKSYDGNPFINKKAIIDAFNRYERNLNPLNKDIIPAITGINLNIEGNFIAHNIPEISSVVMNDTCISKNLYKILDKHDDISHVALSTYAYGLKNCLDLIKIIQRDFSQIELFVGGVGAVYPSIQRLVPADNLCIGEGVNFLRKKFNLKPLLANEFKIPLIFGNVSSIPISIKAAYLVTQLGCPHRCDFCITPNFYDYLPFSKAEKIIKFFESLISTSKKDIFVYLCDPNGFYPEKTWRKVFNYFISRYKEINNNIFLFGLASLHHINKFDLETIQKKSPIKLLLINYGIESTLDGGYIKNKDMADKIIKRLNENGIITFHTCILGLPNHTKKNIITDIRNNCNFKSDIISFNTYKPMPQTSLYKSLKRENRIFFNDIPPEFLYMEGYMPFKHPNLGFGFDILSYAFKAYYESEKTLIDVYSNFSNKLLDIYTISNSRKIKAAIKVFIELSKKNFESFKSRMPNSLSETYQTNLNNIRKRISDF